MTTIRLSAKTSTAVSHLRPDWKTVAEVPEPQVYPESVELLQQDCPVSSVHIIEDGMVKLLHLRADGRAVIVGMRASGSLLGAAEVLFGARSPTTAIAVVPTSTRRISAQTFAALLANQSAFSVYVNNALGREAYMGTISAIELASYPARERLLHFLSELIPSVSSADQCRPTKLRIPLKHYELAQLLAVTPAYLCAIFKQLVCEGVIERKKGLIVLPERKWGASRGAKDLKIAQSRSVRCER